MFDKLKQINELRKMQQKMKEEKFEAVENGVKVVINGNFEVEEIILSQELNPQAQAEALKRCFNRAVKGIQAKIAQSFSHLV